MRRDHLNPTIARNESALWKLYIGDARYGSLGDAGFHAWEILEGRYTLAVLFEFAGTLGLLDLDYIHPRRGARRLPEQLGRRRSGRAEPLRRPAGHPAHRAGTLHPRPYRHLPACRRRQECPPAEGSAQSRRRGHRHRVGERPAARCWPSSTMPSAARRCYPTVATSAWSNAPTPRWPRSSAATARCVVCAAQSATVTSPVRSMRN